MTLLQAIVLAVLQGLTEFLPISSTAHLILAPWLAGWQDQGLTFDVALHAGTLLAVLTYFARDWLRLFGSAFGIVRYGFHYGAHKFSLLLPDFWNATDRTFRLGPIPGPPAIAHKVELDFSLLTLIAIATIPGALSGYFLESYAESGFRNPMLIAGMLMGVALLMWVADRRSPLTRTMNGLGLGDAVVIGLAQAVAVVPGTSRAGITIAAALFRNLARESAARFSFMLGTPIIAGAALKKGLELLTQGFPPGASALHFAVGFVVSAIVGYAAIAFLLRYLQVHTLKIFVAYRLVLGVIILAIEFLRSTP